MSEEQASSPSAKMGDEENPVSGLSGARRQRWRSCIRVAQRGEREGVEEPWGGGRNRTPGQVRVPFGEESQIHKAGPGLADHLWVHPLFLDEDAECLAQSHTTN